MKDAVVDAAMALDKALLALLIKDDRARKHFFLEVDEILVFDKLAFQKVVTNRNFLPNSFTEFSNKIGLSTQENLGANDIILEWPYKDCVLEGGQTREEESRSEIFHNQTIASEDIDRLFEPKAFVNWKRFNSGGANQATEINKSDNLIIRGNNLIALHSLKQSYAGRIKLIYIDPPYNTGNDSFQYNDSFKHSTWLTFMKNRLEAAWQLLSSDGAFFIQVDDSEYAYLKVLCDEVFGRDAFREAIVIKSSTESGVNAINVKRGERLFKVKEYILFYSKSNKFRFKPFFTKTDFNVNYKYKVVKSGNEYSIADVSKRFASDYSELPISKQEKDLLTKNAFENYALNNAQNMYSLEKNIKKAGAKFKAFAAENKSKNIVEEFKNSLGQNVLIYDGGVLVPLGDRVIADGKNLSFGVLASDLWVDIGTTPSSEGGTKFSNGKKPEKLLKRIIEMTTNPGDIVLDYHLGSGTTAAVAHKMNRQYIGIEQLDYLENDTTVRLQNVINGEESGISKILKWQGGGSFVYAELAKNNAKIIERIIIANDAQLIELLHSMIESPYISYKILPEKVLANIDAFKSLNLSEKRDTLISFLDKNDLYIHLSEIEDKDFFISENDRQMINKFYNL